MKLSNAMLLLTLSCLSCVAQPAVITFKDSTQLQVKIQATSKASLYTDKGTKEISQISKVIFYTDKVSNSTLDLLKQNNIVVGFTTETPTTDGAPPTLQSVVIASKQTEVDLQTVVNSLDEFNKTRTAAKTMELLGAVGLATHFLLQNSYTKELERGNLDAKAPPKALPVAACALLSVGFIIDLSAASKLRLKR